MTDNQLKIGQVEINPDQTKDRLIKVFVARANPAKEKALGKIFGLMEAKFAQQPDLEFLENLAKRIRNNYYQLSEAAEETGLENIFEQALKKTNGEIGNFIKKESGFDVKNFNALVAVLKDHQLHFAPVGSAHAYLVHHLTKNNYQMVDILETTKNIEAFPSVTKLFSNIVSGEIKDEDSLLIANDSFLDYLSLDKIKSIVTSLPAGSAAEQLKSLLLEVNNHNIFGGLIAKFGPLTAKIKSSLIKPQAGISPQNSMDDLVNTETTTEKFLNPTFSFNLGKYLAGIFGFFTNRSLVKSAYRRGSYGHSQSLFKIIFRQIIKFLVMLGYILKGLFSLIGRRPVKNEETGEKNPLSQRLNNRLNRFSALPRGQKMMIIGALVFIIAFSQGIVVLSKRQSNRVLEQQYSQLTSQIKEKHDAAEASLIYKEDDRARQLLLEAKGLITTLPQNSRQHQNDYNTLQAKNETLLEKTSKIVMVDNPEVIADLASLNPQHAKQILPLLDKLISYDPAKNGLYEINPATKEIKDLAVITAQIGRLQLGALADNEYLLFYHTNNGLAKFNTTNNTLEPVIAELNEQKVKDLLVYNKRLYILDNAGNQIYKHNNTTDGFSSGTAWLVGANNLNEAVSFTIDGSIYVLKSNGEIYKFLKGEKQEFTPATLEKPLNQPTKIYTDLDSNFLYILDPQNQRLVVLDKEGKLQAQYTSDKFTDLKDFVIKEKENKIYLLNNTQILVMPVQNQG
ncbi:MAG: hypothetical protein V1692_01465 [bacterium]